MDLIYSDIVLGRGGASVVGKGQSLTQTFVLYTVWNKSLHSLWAVPGTGENPLKLEERMKDK